LKAIFSRFFVVLAAKSLPKIQPFGGRFQKRRFSENPYKTLAVRTKIEVRIQKKLKKNREKIDSKIPSKKISKKTFQKLVWGPILGSKTPPESRKNPFKKHVKKRSEK